MSCAQVEAPYFSLALDTTPPRVAVVASGIVEPPDVLSVRLTTDEPYGRLEAVYTDSLGKTTTYGVGRTSSTTALLEMPTVSLAPGGGTLTLTVADEVGNLAVVDWPLVIDAPRAYDVDLALSTAYGVEMTMADAFSAEATLGHAHLVQVTPDHGGEIDLEVRSAYGVELEVDSA